MSDDKTYYYRMLMWMDECDRLRGALQVASEMLSEITSDAERLYYRKTIDAITAALEDEG